MYEQLGRLRVFGDNRKAMLQDIAILTGGKGLVKSLVRHVTIADLGSAARIVIDKDNTDNC